MKQILDLSSVVETPFCSFNGYLWKRNRGKTRRYFYQNVFPGKEVQLIGTKYGKLNIILRLLILFSSQTSLLSHFLRCFIYLNQRLTHSYHPVVELQVFWTACFASSQSLPSLLLDIIMSLWCTVQLWLRGIAFDFPTSHCMFNTSMHLILVLF